MTVPHMYIYPLTHHASGILWPDYIALLTLCLAPVIAHVISGVPQVSAVGTSSQPPWHERICQYNPTSFLWRYFAIANRRLCARNWTRHDMAAANALFWTSGGWDGSKERAAASRPLLLNAPDRSHTEILSSTTIKTLIITLQGVDATYAMVNREGDKGSFTAQLALSTIFQPMAVFGLLRLLAVPWLTENCVYASTTDTYKSGDSEAVPLRPLLPVPSINSIDERTSISDRHESVDHGEDSPSACWASWVLRVVYLIPILLLIALGMMYMLPSDENDFRHFTVTTFLVNLFYLIFLIATFLIFIKYFIWGDISTTIIPCISAWWYKLYTAGIFALALCLIIIASVETWRTPCGRYSTWPPDTGEALGLCY